MSSQLLEYIKQETGRVLSELTPGQIRAMPRNTGASAPKKDDKDVEKFAKLIAAQVKKREAKYRKIYPAAMKSMAVSIKDGSRDQKIMAKVSEAFWKFVATGDGLLYTSIVRKAAQKGIDLSSQNEEVTSLCKKVLLDVIEKKDGGSKGSLPDYLDYIDGSSSTTMEGFGIKFRNAFIKNILLPSIKGALEKNKEINYFDPASIVNLAQTIGGTMGSTGVAALTSKNKKKKPGGGSGRKRGRHPLRARQERLSRRIKVPVAKIQDMLKPYFAGGGKLTFKESINRNIILEGDGAYGGETEAAIKAFQAQVNDLIDKGILKGVKSLGKPDGLFGPASLRAFQALKKQPEALAQSKLGSAQVDPNTLAGGVKQAAAQAAAGAKPAADAKPVDYGPLRRQDQPYAGKTLGTSKSWQDDMSNIKGLDVNRFKGYNMFAQTISELWDEYSNDDVNEETLPYLKEFAIMMMNSVATVDFPDKKLMADIYKLEKNEMYKSQMDYYIGIVKQFEQSLRKSKWVEKIFQDLNTLQVYFKGAGKEGIGKALNQTVAPIKNKVAKDKKKAEDSPYTDVDNAAMAASKAPIAADAAAQTARVNATMQKTRESKVYAYLEKLINEEFDKILG